MGGFDKRNDPNCHADTILLVGVSRLSFLDFKTIKNGGELRRSAYGVDKDRVQTNADATK